MGLFSHQPDFWTWWAGFRERGAALLDADRHEQFAAEVTPHVQRIHPELTWETTEPRVARHALVVSGNGVDAHRSIAERWLRAAPTADEMWEFFAARQPHPGMLTATLNLDDHEFDLGHVALGVRYAAERARVDVVVYHPDFAFIHEQARRRVAFLALDWALGEDDVSRWIGAVAAAEEKPMDPVSPTALAGVVKDVAADFTEPRWALLQGRDRRGRELVVRVRFPLRRVDFPLLDVHISVEHPDAREKEHESFEDHLAANLPADAELVAVETIPGRRTFHIYAEDDTANTIAKALRQLSGRARVTAEPDPGWTAVQPFLS